VDTLRRTLLRDLAAARRLTDALFARLAPSAFSLRPIAERHRVVFYVGHLEAFDWNLLCRDLSKQPSRHPAWENLFSFGIDPVDGHLPADPPEAWPALSEVRGWGRVLRPEVDDIVERAPLRGWLENGWAARLAVEHRLMHAETLTYMFSRLPPELRAPGPAPIGLGRAPPDNPLVDVPAGDATLGLEAPLTGWDNEQTVHRVRVPAFRIQRFPVTNADFLRFIDAGGYAQPELWTKGAWTWREQERIEHPAFWSKSGDAFTLRTLSGEVPLPLAYPVYVSQAEASAYARWKGLSLPTEAQWHRAALGDPHGGERRFPWGEDEPVPGTHGNFGFLLDDPCPVDAHPKGDSAFGVAAMVGNGWQWTRTVFAPFEGFRPVPFYLGYSEPFFDGRHFVLKGGSPVTDVTLLRRSFRNWFQPHYPHVFATFRLVQESAA
jgi:ergothioneine biosynthesis protein EgtB